MRLSTRLARLLAFRGFPRLLLLLALALSSDAAQLVEDPKARDARIVEESLTRIAELEELAARGRSGEEGPRIEAAEKLALALEDPRYPVRVAAAELLAHGQHEPTAVRALVSCARHLAREGERRGNQRRSLSSKSKKVRPARQGDVQDLGRQLQETSKLLRQQVELLVEDHESLAVEEAVARALGGLPDDRAVQALAELLDDHPPGPAAETAFAGLLRLGSRPALRAALAYFDEWEDALSEAKKEVRKAGKQKPGRKVPENWAKEKWVERETQRIALDVQNREKRVEFLREHGRELVAGLEGLAVNLGLSATPESGRGRDWSRWFKANFESFPASLGTLE